MGFAPDRVEWALHATNNSGLQSALDHLEANQEKPVPDFKTQSSSASVTAGASGDYDEEEQAALMDILKSIIADAQTLAEPEYASSPIAPAASALYTLPTLAAPIW